MLTSPALDASLLKELAYAALLWVFDDELGTALGSISVEELLVLDKPELVLELSAGEFEGSCTLASAALSDAWPTSLSGESFAPRCLYQRIDISHRFFLRETISFVAFVCMSLCVAFARGPLNCCTKCVHDVQIEPEG